MAFDTIGRIYLRQNINDAGWTSWKRFITDSDLYSCDEAWKSLTLPDSMTGTVRYAKRCGTVIVVGQNLSIPVGTATNLGTLPTGYHPGTQIVGQLTYTDAAEIFGYYSISNTGGLTVSNRKGTAGAHIYFVASYPAMT